MGNYLVGKQKVPLTVLIVFALMASIGSTKVTFGLSTVLSMMKNNLIVNHVFVLTSINVILGTMSFGFAVAFLLQKAWARKPLIFVAGILFLVDVIWAASSFWLRAAQTDGPSLLHITLNWGCYVVVIWLAISQSAKQWGESKGAV